jgi:hypothetical protein
MSPILNAVLAANERYAATFGEKAKVIIPSVRHFAVLTNQHSHSRIHGAPPIVVGGTSLTRPSLKYVVSYVKQNSEQ